MKQQTFHLPLGLGLAAMIALTAPGAMAEPARYEIDPDHLSVGFLVEHIGFAKILGMFRKAGGSFSFDEAAGKITDVQFEIDAASVFTNHKKRDDHLRGADFLNASEFPTLRYAAAGATRISERVFRLDGELTLLGKTLPVPLEATWNKSGVSPIGGSLFGGKPYVTGVSIRGSFQRSAYGMTYAVDNGWVGDRVEFLIEFEARRQ